MRLRIHPELRTPFARDISRPAASFGFWLFLIGLAVWVMTKRGSATFVMVAGICIAVWMIVIAVIGMRRSLLRFNRATDLMSAGSGEKVEITFSKTGVGAIYSCEVRSRENFNPEELDRDGEFGLYYINGAQLGNALLEAPAPMSVFADAYYGFGPSDPLMVRWQSGVLWLDNKNAECESYAAGLALKALSMAQANKNSEAVLGLFERALEGDPKNLDVRILRARYLAENGDMSGAIGDVSAVINAYERTVSTKPEYSDVYVMRGWYYTVLGAHEHAVVDFSKAISIKADQTDYYSLRAWSLRQLERNQEAVSDLTRFLELTVTSPNTEDRAKAHLDRGFAYAALEDSNKAVADFNESVKLYPTPSCHYALGCVRAAEGRYHDSLKEFSRAVELQPDFTEAYAARAEVHRIIGNPHLADQDLRQIDKLHSEGVVNYTDQTVQSAAPPVEKKWSWHSFRLAFLAVVRPIITLDIGSAHNVQATALAVIGLYVIHFTVLKLMGKVDQAFLWLVFICFVFGCLATCIHKLLKWRKGGVDSAGTAIAFCYGQFLLVPLCWIPFCGPAAGLIAGITTLHGLRVKHELTVTDMVWVTAIFVALVSAFGALAGWSFL